MSWRIKAETFQFSWLCFGSCNITKISPLDSHRGTVSLTLKSTGKACHAFHFPISSNVWVHFIEGKNMTISVATLTQICFGLPSAALKQFPWWTSK